MRLTALLVALVMLGSGTITGCGSSDTSAMTSGTTVATTTTPAPAPNIVISNYAYDVRGPVRAGQQVIVVNDDQASHSIATDGSDAIDLRVSGGGGTETFTAPTAPGTYEFHCKYHANMHGTLVVQ